MSTLIGLSLFALFVFPVFTFGVMWFVNWQRSARQERPEPTRRSESSRTIPGGNKNRRN